MVFHVFWWRGKSDVAELKLRLAFSVGSHSHGFSIGFGSAENQAPLNLSQGWPSRCGENVMVFIGSGGAENQTSLDLSLGWPSVWGA